MSSVSVGTDSNLIVALRNLNTVLSLRADGGGLQWVLSSSALARSNFTFERDADRFFDPHSARQLADGRLLLLDVGNDRPGCVADLDYKGCFSRAVIYSLNFTTRVAKIDWQFEAPYKLDAVDAAEWAPDVAAEIAHWMTMTHDFFNWDGGSVERLDSGYIQVAFTSELPVRAANANFSMHVWEVDERARVRSMLAIPHASGSYKAQGGYRAVPLETLQGESTDAPAGFEQPPWPTAPGLSEAELELER